MERINSEVSFDSYLKKRSDIHLMRKLWHMFTGSLGIFCFYFFDVDKASMTLSLAKLTVVAFLVDFIRLKFSGMNSSVMYLMKPFMRDSEAKSLSGLPFYALGVTLSLFFFEEKVAILSILFLVFSDPIASYFGVLFGKQKVLPNKTFEGCVAAYVTCYFLTLLYGLSLGVNGFDLFIFSLLAGAVGMLSEAFSMGLDDNLTIPVVAGSGLSLLNLFIPLF